MLRIKIVKKITESVAINSKEQQFDNRALFLKLNFKQLLKIQRQNEQVYVYNNMLDIL